MFPKTIFSFLYRFCLEIETYYTGDGGDQENVFKLSDSEMRNRVVDLIDVVKDQVTFSRCFLLRHHNFSSFATFFFFFQDGTVYEDADKEDPTLFVSEKTGRGPLSQDWIDEYSEACRGQTQPTSDGKAIMCAYKLCKVEFRYWGMQSKIERFIHDVALRKTMLKAHSQVPFSIYTNTKYHCRFLLR